MVRQLWAAVRAIVVLTIVLGVAYPLAVLLVAQLSSSKANGSIITSGGQEVGSSLIGQNFDGPTWFHPRPSAAGEGYDATSSGASNLNASSPQLLQEVQERKRQVAVSEGVLPDQVPPDAVTASQSGLDPHISPQYAAIQITRVARARGLTTQQVQQLVSENTQNRSLGFLGERTVNVVKLNVALAQASGTKKPQ